MALTDECFECQAPAEHDHHPIPRVRGGTKTIPLCTPCHSLAHGQSLALPQLIKEGIARARANGTRWGKPRHKHYKRAVRMHIAGFTHGEIARKLEISYFTVRSIVNTWRRNNS